MTDERFDYLLADIRHIRNRVDQIAERVVRLEVKAALWGAGAGAALGAIVSKVLS